MKLFLTLFLNFFVYNIYSQTNDIIYISFHHQNPIVVNSEIDIYFYQDFREQKFYINVKTSKFEKQYFVSNEKAANLIDIVSKISAIDIIQDVRNCLDGSDTEITVSKSILSQNSVTYSVNCLSSEDEKTPWKDYFKAVNLILDLAQLKFSDLE